MKNFYRILSILLLSASIVKGQDVQKKFPAKPGEDKEIKGDNHLGKEMQQKQLSAPPQVLHDSASAGKTDRKKMPVRKKGAKNKHS